MSGGAPAGDPAEATLQVGEVGVFVEGTGPRTIVMIHGWPDSWRLWNAQVEALRSGFRCVRFSLAGFEPGSVRRARSLAETVELIRQIVDAVSPERPVTLMLHDWGCLFGYQFAMRHPARVEAVIGADIGDAGSRAHIRSLSTRAKALTFAYQVWLAVAWRIGGAAGDRMTRFMARLLRAPADPARIGSRMNYPYYIAWTRAAGSYRQAVAFKPVWPMLFIYGTRKPFMFHSPGWAEALARRPGNRVLALETGHWVMTGRQTGAFNQAVLAWLGEQSLQGAG